LLDRELSSYGAAAEVVLIDDASVTPCPSDLIPDPLDAITQVNVLRLRRNLGHQRALCIGLCAIGGSDRYVDSRGVVIMDADGEDKPSDVPRLLERFSSHAGARLIFARRERRSEGFIFTVSYKAYRVLHLILTGIPVRVGNFSVVPRSFLDRLSVVSELWNHYAAAVVHAGLPTDSVPTTRGRRLFGESKMHFVSLIGHGLSAMSVFGDRIGVRSLIATISLGALLFLALVGTIAASLLTPIAFPVWAVTATGVIIVLLTQSVILSLAFSMLIHVGRAGTTFLPARDYQWFIEGLRCVWKRDG
ncbi:MAG TPA: glycosyltransferase, partial [Gemmatimonadaceae bacterium]|nr:glycosyltransferase [Gemmatimonadaceae bacterium]